jgi:tetratricopeptide (TPR) repeat protein
MGSSDENLLLPMHFFASLAMSCLLLLSSWVASAADVYSDLNRLIGTGQWPAALNEAQLHLKTNPNDPQMRLLLSRIQDGQGQTEAATATLQALTQSYPELPEPHNNLAVLLARQNRLDEALLALQAAIRARPDYATAQENLGDVHVALAIQAYQNANQIAIQSGTPVPRVAGKRLATEQVLRTLSP